SRSAYGFSKVSSNSGLGIPERCTTNYRGSIRLLIPQLARHLFENPPFLSAQAADSVLRDLVEQLVHFCRVLLRRFLLRDVLQWLPLPKNDGVATLHDFVHVSPALAHRPAIPRHRARHVF